MAALIDKRVGALTLGVRDLARARRFYEDGLGWPRDGGEDDIAFCQLNGFVLGLYEWEKLAADAAVEARGAGFRGVALAYCVREPEDLERVLARAEAAVAGGAVRLVLLMPCHHAGSAAFCFLRLRSSRYRHSRPAARARRRARPPGLLRRATTRSNRCRSPTSS